MLDIVHSLLSYPYFYLFEVNGVACLLPYISTRCRLISRLLSSYLLSFIIYIEWITRMLGWWQKHRCQDVAGLGIDNGSNACTHEFDTFATSLLTNCLPFFAGRKIICSIFESSWSWFRHILSTRLYHLIALRLPIIECSNWLIGYKSSPIVWKFTMFLQMRYCIDFQCYCNMVK